MGLLATIKSATGLSLGTRDDVVAKLSEHFPNATFGWRASGQEMIAAAASRGVSFPETLRVHFETQPRAFEGIWEGPGYSVEFYFGEPEMISKIDIELRGETTNFDAMEKRLEEHERWIVTYP